MVVVRRIPEAVGHGHSAAQWPLNGGQRFERTTTHHKVTIGLGSKRFQLEFERVEHRFSTSGPRIGAAGEGARARHWSSMALAGLLLLSLFLAAAQMLRGAAPATQYSAVIAIPLKPVAVAAVQRPHSRRLARPAPAAPAPRAGTHAPNVAVDPPADNAEGAVTTITSIDDDVEPLPAATGERAVAVWGPRRDVNGKSCRDVQVFTRDVDGAVSVKPAVKCDNGRP